MSSKWNRNYRLVWSAGRKEWIVASEYASPNGKGISSGAASRLLVAALMAAGMMVAAPDHALAAFAGTGGAATTCTGPQSTIASSVTGGSAGSNSVCTATLTDSLKVTNTGSIFSTSTLANYNARGGTRVGTVTVDRYATGVTIDNYGAIKSGGYNHAIYVDPYATGTTIINELGGQISGTGGLAALWFDGYDRNTSLVNDGVISERLLTGSRVDALRVFSNMNGTLTNNGMIRVQNTASSGADARAIGMTGVDVYGVLTNSGTISATARNNGSSSSAYVRALWAGTVAGTVINSGTITASAVDNATTGGSPSATAYGVLMSLTAGGSFSNSGTIQVTAQAVTSNAWAYGAHISNVAGTFVNSGTITAKAIRANTNFENAQGMDIFGLQPGGVVKNSGTITATTSLPANRSAAYSIHERNSTGGVIINQPGGLLRGNVAIASTSVGVDNYGTIEIPDGVTNASIAGNYTQHAGGVLRIDASSTASYAKLTVGTGNLLSGSVIDLYAMPGATFTAGQVLPAVITATSALNVSTPPTVTDNYATLNFTPVLSGNSIALYAGPDTIPPVINLTNGSVISIAPNSTFTDPGATVTDQGFATNLTPTVSGTVNTAVPGSYTLTYTVADAAGNTASTTRTVIVDNIPPPAPVITIPSPVVMTNQITQPAISGTAEAGATVTVTDGTTVIGTTTADRVGNWLLPANGAVTLAAGSHRFTAFATDSVGNVGPVSRTVTYIIDTSGGSGTCSLNMASKVFYPVK